MHVLLLKVIYLYDFHFYYPENSWYVQITIVKSDNTHSNISRIFCEILFKFIASWHFNVIFLFWVVKLEHNICISCLFHLKMKNCTRVLFCPYEFYTSFIKHLMIDFSPFYFFSKRVGSWWILFVYFTQKLYLNSLYLVFLFINEKTVCVIANHSMIIYLIHICSNITTNTMHLRWKLVTNAYSSTTIHVLNCLLTQRKTEREDDDSVWLKIQQKASFCT